MIVETDDRSKPGELIYNKAVSLTVKTSDYIWIGFALGIYYSEDTGYEKEYFLILLRIVWMFLLKK